MAKRATGARAATARSSRNGAGRSQSAAVTVARQSSIVETPEGFFWRDAENDRLVGPFRTMRAAIADRDSPGTDDDPIDPIDGAAVLAAEAEIGIDDFIDPDTGEPTHGFEPHVRDDH